MKLSFKINKKILYFEGDLTEREIENNKNELYSSLNTQIIKKIDLTGLKNIDSSGTGLLIRIFQVNNKTKFIKNGHLLHIKNPSDILSFVHSHITEYIENENKNNIDNQNSKNKTKNIKQNGQIIYDKKENINTLNKTQKNKDVIILQKQELLDKSYRIIEEKNKQISEYARIIREKNKALDKARQELIEKQRIIEKISNTNSPSAPVQKINTNRETHQNIIESSSSIDLSNLPENAFEQIQNLEKTIDNPEKYFECCENILKFIFPLDIEHNKHKNTLISLNNIIGLVLDNKAKTPFFKDLKKRVGVYNFALITEISQGPITKTRFIEIINVFEDLGAGSFGIICTKNPLTPEAETMRIEQWIAENKMIIFLNNSQLIKAIILKTKKSRPEKIIKNKIEKLNGKL